MSTLRGAFQSYGAFFRYPPSIIEKTIYYGKKISYAKVKQIVGNDIKYSYLLESMRYYASREVGLNEEFDDDFICQYDEEHYCLFTMPINFDAKVFLNEKSLAIEEFDSEIKLNYDGVLKAIEENGIAGELYIKDHELPLKLFKNFFDMLYSSYNFCSDDICKRVFECYIFNFKLFAAFENLDDINFFLDICDYVYDYSNYCDSFFKKYRAFVNEYYRDLELGERPKF